MNALPKILDAIIIGGDVPDEYLGKDVREKMRLTVEGFPASFLFLQAYCNNGRDAEQAQAEITRNGVPFVSLNGPYLQAFLQKHGLNVALVPLLSPYKDRFRELLQRKPPAVIISTTFLPFAEHVDKLAAMVKQALPDTIVIAGGIQVWKSYQHKQLLDSGQMDEGIREAVSEHNFFTDPNRPSAVDVFVVSASGEHTLAALLERIREGRDYHELPNLATFHNGRWQFTPQEEEPYTEIKMDWGRHELPPGPVYIPVQAGQGCGFQCAFCDFRDLRSRHLRTAESIVEEIRTIPSVNGLRHVYFTDDNLFSSRNRAREICRALIQSEMKICWRGMVRVSIIDDEVAELMARSGCLEVLLGIESGDADMLQRMGKTVSPDGILRALGCLSRAGINSKSTFIVGFPGETEKTIQNTVDLLNAYPTDGPALHRYLFFRFGVLPLSEVASPESREKYRLKGYGYNWSHSSMTSEEAVAHMGTLHDRIKVELSPNYVLEVPKLPGVTIEDLKQVAVLRNRLARLQRGQDGPATEAALWKRLQAVLAP